MLRASTRKKAHKRRRTFPLNQDQWRKLKFKAEIKYAHTGFRYDSNTGRLSPHGFYPNEIEAFKRDAEFSEFNGLKKPTTYAWPPYSQAQLDRINGVTPKVVPKPAIPAAPKVPANVPPKQPAATNSAWPLPGAAAFQPSPPIIQTNTESKKIVKVENKLVSMPHRGRGRGRGSRGGRQTTRSRRWKIQNAALRPKRLPFKQVVPVELKTGYFDYSFKITSLIPELLTVYEEVRITSLKVVFLVKDVAVTAGLYTTILLDQNGYGNPLKSTETWFKRVADMPGSLVHHAVRGFKLTWVATEPDSKNYVKVIDTEDIAKTIARLYIIGQESSLAISGVLLVRGHCLCRGQYYDATKLTVDMMRKLRIKEIEDEDGNEDAASGSTSLDSFNMLPSTS